MSDWLSTTWEANWRPFQYFNLYRLVLAGLFFLAILLPHEWTARLELAASGSLLALAIAYLFVILGGLFLSFHWQQHFNFQLSLQVIVDVVVVSLFMYAAGGVGSGIGVLLLVSLAAASMVGRGRLVLFYAALATLAALLSQLYGVFVRGFDPASIFQAGILSAGFFATAILARLLGQRVMVNEDLAFRRGVELENQRLISQRVVERMLDGILVLSRDGLVIRHNPMAISMLGIPLEINGELSRCVPALHAGLLVWVSGDGPETSLFVGGDGKELRARFEKTSSSDGEVLIFLEDVGRIKERAQQLKLASLGRLTASIAHEIRNPLSAISHAGELLREERRGEIQDRLLRILGDNIQRLDRIVADVLQLGRQNRAEPELLVMSDFCTAFVESFAAAEGLAGDVLHLEIEADATLCFDRAHLHQVLWNLLGNALRYCSRGEASVRLVICRGANEGRMELHVRDDGPGVPEAVREQIFEPFFTTHTQGTGLGLFIARELCAANGASLELTAELAGAHFILIGRNDTCH
ncbi:sensor histidine kinase [Quatrionicoccus australiensis]|uniref:sensor histidine kinase n=1 Tax=Quatrionicoccus australiensis TaxID=138118 RepID=UPI001CFC3C07|nr:ATP-binding protein [Quatrionicoccus australiensis]MCB4359351.1 PAS domain-containing protein [Quatrionicoccus australiensis]